MAQAMTVVVLEEGDTKPAAAEGAQVVVAVRTVADRATVSGTATTTTTTMAHTSTVLASTLTSGLIRRIMAPGGIMNGDEEDVSAATMFAVGTVGSDRGAITSGTPHIVISSDHRHMVRCRIMGRCLSIRRINSSSHSIMCQIRAAAASAFAELAAADSSSSSGVVDHGTSTNGADIGEATGDRY